MKLSSKSTMFMDKLSIKAPIICGAMYPCSNPELVAAVSNAGGIGIIQPISLTYVYGYDFRKGLRYIRTLTDKPVGMNALIESSSRKYHQQMQAWLEIALEENIRFFVTSLGKPDWVVKKVHQLGGIVYHDVTEKKWANKAIDVGVDGLIAVNNRAGGHAGQRNSEQLYDDLSAMSVPVICAGGISTAEQLSQALKIGYAGVQIGTRFIATEECSASQDYKEAIVQANEQDIVLTERITGVPVSVIRTPYVEKSGVKLNLLVSWMLRSVRFKRIIRTLLALKSLRKLKQDTAANKGRADYWQAGKSVSGINAILSVKDVIRALQEGLDDVPTL